MRPEKQKIIERKVAEFVTCQIDDNFSSAMIVDDLEFSNVAVLHHNTKELDDDFGCWANDDLTFATLFGIVDRLEGIGQNVHANHVCVSVVKLKSKKDEIEQKFLINAIKSRLGNESRFKIKKIKAKHAKIPLNSSL